MKIKLYNTCIVYYIIIVWLFIRARRKKHLKHLSIIRQNVPMFTIIIISTTGTITILLLPTAANKGYTLRIKYN